MLLLLRSMFFYLFLVFGFRFLGKRQLGEMEPSEFVVSLLIADLAAAPMQEPKMKISSALVPITIVLLLEFLLSLLSYHFISVRKIFCGKPVILMEDGKILSKNLKRTRVTPDELTEHLREKGIVDLKTIKYAILETNGQISALIDPEYQPPTCKDLSIDVNALSLPVTIICNGTIIPDNLKLSGKTDAWVKHILCSKKCDISQVLLLTVDGFDNIYLAVTE